MQHLQPSYRDHADAGAVLARSLVKYAGQNVVVFGVGPGGVAVAAPVAGALGADLDVLVVRRLTVPGEPDRRWGAMAALGDCVQVAADRDADARRVPGGSTAGEPKRDVVEVRRLEHLLRDGRPPEPVRGRPVIVVGDGLAGVAAMRAAASAVRRHHPARLVVALPAGTSQTCQELRRSADEVVCPCSLGPFRAVAPVYAERTTIGPEDVRALLSASSTTPRPAVASRQIHGRVG